MKKVALFALLFTALTAAAQAAHVEPLQNRVYQCYYSNPTMGETNGGFSRFTWNYMNTADQKRGIEYYDVVAGYTENRKVTFAKPVDYNSAYGPYTVWELTFNPYGPQCKRAAVRYSGGQIEATECSDGHSRVCYAW